MAGVNPTSTSVSLSTPLTRYLAAMVRPGNEATPSQHLEKGAACVGAEDLAAVRRLRPALQVKLAGITDSARLRDRIALLLCYLDEEPAVSAGSCQREAAFAVLYFLKGFDLIPDSVPGIGLLDDAMVVETVLRRNTQELREHWVARGRSWPEPV